MAEVMNTLVMFSENTAPMHVAFWLIAMIIFVVGELITIGLTSIWFAAGALAALLAALMGFGLIGQIVVFILVSGILLWLTRPWAQRFINSKVQKTNVDSIVGERMRLTERVNNFDHTGRATVHGQDWSVQIEDDKETLEPGALVEVVRVSGVKLIVKKVEETKKEKED